MYKLTLTLDGSKRTTNLTVESSRPFTEPHSIYDAPVKRLPKNRISKRVVKLGRRKKQK